MPEKEEKQEPKEKNEKPPMTEEDKKIIAIIKGKDEEIAKLKSKVCLLEQLEPVQPGGQKPERKKTKDEMIEEMTDKIFTSIREVWRK